MFASYPTPTPDFNTQSQPEDSVYNKPVTNYPLAVPGGLSAINTNVCPQQDGYSESPLLLSSSTISYPNYGPLLSQPNFNDHLSFTTPIERSRLKPQHGTSSRALVPATKRVANKALISRLGWLWLLLKFKLKLRDGRKHRRRYSASDYTSRTTGYSNVNYFPTSLSVSIADDIASGGLVTSDQVGQFNLMDQFDPLFFENHPLGIMAGDGNSLLQVPAAAPRVAECLEETTLSETSVGQPQQLFLPRQPKRPIDCVELDESSASETEEKPLDKKRPKTSSSLRFACPFYKHDPERYETSRSCCGPGWETVHRVKEHIFRSHEPEHECQRCFESFKTEQLLTKHVRARVQCEVQSRSSQEKEGINASQSKALHARAKKCNPGSDPKEVEEERWNDVYKIIFPGEGQVPSPYYDRLQKSNNDNFEMNLMAAFGRCMQGKLECLKNMQPNLTPLVIQDALSALKESLQSCRQKPRDDSSQNSRLTSSQYQESQSFLGGMPQWMGIDDNFLRRLDSDPQFLAQAMGGYFAPTGF
ncbi:hypothetical protein F53441_7769 [Fusarium austroafricanum]|uniref:C2H2-type domain-containing protein n=1 Tax=Fusarium austroafricanum TaxID=2364996 RepID=A0A8H4KEY9_9HYPO|nr:hypothetical protein F53441_7769 [Fusarium austroafricanum]